MDSGVLEVSDNESPEMTVIAFDFSITDVIRVQRNVALNPDDPPIWIDEPIESAFIYPNQE